MGDDIRRRAEMVEIIESRWHVTIRVHKIGGEVEEFVASADRAFTEGAGIWFGTAQEYQETGDAL